MRLILLISAGLLTLCSCAEKTHTIVVLGDSRATGFYVDETGMSRHGYGWPEQLAIKLGSGWSVDNRAVDGSNITLALNWLKKNPNAKPDILTLQFGWNEMAQMRIGDYPKMSLDDYRAALVRVREWCDKRGVRLIVIDAVAPAYYEGHPNATKIANVFGLHTGKDVIEKLNDLSSVTRDEMSPYLVKTGLTAECYNPADFVHPNLEGHKRIEAAVERALFGTQPKSQMAAR